MIRKTIKPVFGQKHKDYIAKAVKSTISVAEGAVRSGKTVDNIAAFAYILERGTPDRIHLATGSTAANAKLNIGDANGFGLEYIFRGRCRWTKYRGNEALAIKVQHREYIVIFAGGGKSDSFKKIRGNSYGMWIATEINLHHDDTIKEAFNRQLAAKCRRIFWDLNPGNPNDPIYSEYIDAFPEQFGSAYNYEHFVISDNASITQTRIKEIENQYIKGSVWYRRDILGERCVADGLIYQYFADNTDEFLIDNIIDFCRETGQTISRFTIGVDFGGTGSATKFQLTGFTDKWTVLAIDEEYIDEPLDPDALNERFSLFVQRAEGRFGSLKKYVTYADSAEQILIRGFQNVAKRDRLPTAVYNAQKSNINERIKLTLLLMAQKRLFVCQKCEHLIEAWQQAVYDPTKTDDTRLDNGTTDIDSLDAFEYSIEPYQERLVIGDRNRQKIIM